MYLEQQNDKDKIIQSLLKDVEHYKNCYKKKYNIAEGLKNETIHKQETILKQQETTKELQTRNDFLSEGQLDLSDTIDRMMEYQIVLEEQVAEMRSRESLVLPKKREISREVDNLGDYNNAPKAKRNKN